LVWKKGTSRMTSMPDFTVEIEIEEDKAELIYQIVSAIERIVERRKGEGDNNGRSNNQNR